MVWPLEMPFPLFGRQKLFCWYGRGFVIFQAIVLGLYLSRKLGHVGTVTASCVSVTWRVNVIRIPHIMNRRKRW